MVAVDQVARRENPRLSAQELARYHVARPKQRDSIVKRNRDPQTPPIIYYKEATQAVAHAIANGNAAPLTQAIDHQHTIEIDAQNWRSGARRTNQIAAMQAAAGFHVPLGANMTVETVLNQRNPPLQIEGVNISIRPELRLAKTYRGTLRHGGLMLWFHKDKPIDEDVGKLLASLLRLSLERFHDHVAPSWVMVYDVFHGRCISAPRSYARQQQDIAAACREVAWRWHAL